MSDCTKCETPNLRIQPINVPKPGLNILEKLSSIRSIEERAAGGKREIRVIPRGQTREVYGHIGTLREVEVPDNRRDEAGDDEHYRGHAQHHDLGFVGYDDLGVDAPGALGWPDS